MLTKHIRDAVSHMKIIFITLLPCYVPITESVCRRTDICISNTHTKAGNERKFLNNI